MTLELIKPLQKTFQETTNLVILTIFVWVSVLTRDLPLLGVVVVFETAYLILGCRVGRFEKLIQSRPAVTLLDQVLLLVSVSGFVVILFFGFGKHLLDYPFPNLTHAEAWEAGALLWTALFLFYYLIKFSFTGNVALDKFVVVVLAGGSVWLINQAWHSMGQPKEHVGWVLAIGGCFFLIDLLLWKQHPNPKEQQLSKASFWWADTPMVVAFTILLCYLLCHHDAEYPDVFVSGVVSCQLLISNAVFIAMEFGLLQLPQPTVTSEVEAAVRQKATAAGTSQGSPAGVAQAD